MVIGLLAKVHRARIGFTLFRSSFVPDERFDERVALSALTFFMGGEPGTFKGLPHSILPLKLFPDCRDAGTFVPLAKSEKGVFRRGDQKAGTAGFTPHTMIDAAGLAVDEIAGIERSIIDLQDSVQEMQFFNAGMRVSGIIGSRIQPDQHAHAAILGIPCEYLYVNTWRSFLPIWFNLRFHGRHERLRSSFTGDSFRESGP